MVEKFLELNIKTYNSLAPEYNKRWKFYLEHQENVLKPFVKKLKKRFNNQNIKILDLGCGVGLDLFILNKFGFKTYGLDFSQKMINYAKKISPNSHFLCKNFLEFDSKEKYQGIIITSFIHLFPKSYMKIILNKIKLLLPENGYCFISITKNDVSNEGYFRKEDYNNKEKRFRKLYMEKEFRDLLNKNGFIIVDFYLDHEPLFKKTWMNFIVEVKKRKD